MKWFDSYQYWADIDHKNTRGQKVTVAGIETFSCLETFLPDLTPPAHLQQDTLSTPSSVDTTACSSTRDSSCCCDNRRTDLPSNRLDRSIPKTCLRLPSPSRPSSL